MKISTAVLIGLALLSVESALIDHVMDMEEKEQAEKQRWNEALIGEINKLSEEGGAHHASTRQR